MGATSRLGGYSGQRDQIIKKIPNAGASTNYLPVMACNFAPQNLKKHENKSLKKNKINVITLGCSKKLTTIEVLMGQLKANGKDVAHEEEGNIVVINTCGFIDNAKEESVNTIFGIC